MDEVKLLPCEELVEAMARINVIHRIQLWYLANGCPPINDVLAAGGALAAAKALRNEVKYLTAEQAEFGQ